MKSYAAKRSPAKRVGVLAVIGVRTGKCSGALRIANCRCVQKSGDVGFVVVVLGNAKGFK